MSNWLHINRCVQQKKEVTMRLLNITLVTVGMLTLIGCTFTKQPQVCVDEWYGYVEAAQCQTKAKASTSPAPTEAPKQAAGLEQDQQRMQSELDAARRQNAALAGRVNDLEHQLTERQENLVKAEKDLLKALQAEISKGTVSIHQFGETLKINLASSLLFDSGEDQIKVEGIDALKRVGAVLKDFPNKHVHVAGYTDNVAIAGALLKKFPSNIALSEARARSASRALQYGGVSRNLSADGYGESHPVASNNTTDGRAKNRRVEITVSKN
jgi:chemotaxis protein MotB